MPSDSRKLSDWLLRQSSPVQQALSHAGQLVRVNAAFREWLREPWSSAVRIAAFDGDTVVIFAAHAAAATVLRFRGEAILAFVRERYNPMCTRLEIKVQPDCGTPN